MLVGPIEVLHRLFELMFEEEFLSSILFTLKRITTGFLIALVLSLVTAPLSFRFRWFSNLMTPLIAALKATPVASITILLLVWISSKNLSIAISFMMVFPIMHTTIEKALDEVDPKLIDMMELYDVKGYKRIRYVYFSEVLPYFESGIKSSLSLAWKSGIAAEVIAIPNGSIGEKLFEAKVYLSTGDLFAWTILIVLLAFLFEKFFLFLIRLLRNALEV